MGKKRTRRLSSDAVGTPHLDGGTWGIRVMGFDEAVRFAEIASKTTFERDPEDGNRILRGDGGQPIKRYAGDINEQVDFAISLVDYVHDYDINDRAIALDRVEEKWVMTDAKSGEVIESIAVNPKKNVKASELVTILIKDMGTSEYEVDDKGLEFAGNPGQLRLRDAATNEAAREKLIKATPTLRGADFEKGTVRTRENHFFWVLRESARLAGEQSGVVSGN
ncbi:MAG TPA: hypothetical protein VN181_02510 [Thermoanaerobaculia bacterium]|nr:hypothetical protein [Thermoanaerobaculia bacterium]